jgi:hypothetical protein
MSYFLFVSWPYPVLTFNHVDVVGCIQFTLSWAKLAPSHRAISGARTAISLLHEYNTDRGPSTRVPSRLPAETVQEKGGVSIRVYRLTGDSSVDLLS